MKKYFFLLVVLTVGMMTLARLGLSGLPFERSWTAGGPIGDEDSMMAWTMTYDFHGGEYSMTGYPPISESGNYSIVLHNKDEYSDDYVLMMTPEAGDPSVSEPYLVSITLYSDGTMSLGSYSSSSSMTFR